MNVYYFYAEGPKVREYLGGTNYFTHCDYSKNEAISKVKKYFKVGTYIECLNEKPKNVLIGFLY